MVPFSVLDLSNIVQGGTAGEALQRSLDLARHAERLGYRRFWLAEHHKDWAAHSCPELLAAILAARTTRMRIGSVAPTPASNAMCAATGSQSGPRQASSSCCAIKR